MRKNRGGTNRGGTSIQCYAQSTLEGSTMSTSSLRTMSTSSLRRRRLPFLTLGSLLASSKTCYGFCTNRGAVPRTTRTRARFDPTNNNACSNAGFASKTTDSMQLGGFAYLPTQMASLKTTLRRKYQPTLRQGTFP